MARKTHKGLTRLNTFSFGELEVLFENNPDKFYWNKYKVSWNRYNNFKLLGTICKHCNREGTKYCLEQDKGGGLHLDLYSEDDTMMTVDHIVPKSKGGTNTKKNLQCLCKLCNEIKGNKHDNYRRQS